MTRHFYRGVLGFGPGRAFCHRVPIHTATLTSLPIDRDQGLGAAGVALTTASLPAEHGNLDSFQPTPICRRGVAPQASPVPRTHRASSSACAFSPDWGHTEYSGGILQRDATGMERTASCDAGARAPNSPSPNESRRIDEPFPRVPALTNKGVPSCASE